MAEDDGARGEVVEHGNIFFLYRPKVEEHEPDGLDDVQRLYMVLEPTGKKQFRLIVIGRKRLPDIGEHERNWGFVEAIAKSGTDLEEGLREETYETKTRGDRDQPAARPAGEGVYVIVQGRNEMFLAYELELPEKPGPVQKALNIAPKGSFAMSIKNPEKGGPVGRGGDRQADYPKSLQKVFRGRRFAPEEPRLLDYEGAEVVFIGAREEPEEELNVSIEAQNETRKKADIFSHLRMAKSRHPSEPLFKGNWA